MRSSVDVIACSQRAQTNNRTMPTRTAWQSWNVL